MGFRWNSPLVQVLAVGFICFCCPGIYNALSSIGGGGQLESDVDENANSALYACFCIVGLFAGAVHNKLGPKWTILIGSITYPLYASSLLVYTHTKASAFTIVAGGILGAGAGLLWTAQGSMMMAYPREHHKGKYIGYFWAIFNMGSILGSLIALGINFKASTEAPGPLGDTTYIVFIALMVCGSLIALTLSSPHNVTHDNGDHIKIHPYPSWTSELTSVLKLFLDWRMLVLTPMFLSSNWFYAYQFTVVNGVYFNVRTQALNNAFYWGCQILGSWSFAKILDKQGLTRRKRAIIGLFVIAVAFIATWVGGIFFQMTFDTVPEKRNDFMDMKVKYIGPLALYMLYGANDAAWQTYCYWLMGSLSNDAAVLSRYAGYYKSIQSAGGAISWRLNGIGTPYMTQLIICFGLLVGSLPGALFFAFRVKDHTDDDDNAQSIHLNKVELQSKDSWQ
ncbi:hypothetical protein DFQ27_005972 [Actinomortierella ambigua]|uniref:MFS general substrate transporter n=1 Tax=Actinomortierella ambigua TaxID=1343610 RepID=A0A9P6PXP2_9FUNG|nr:hypothetical protein DFQ27_005972 [Actinomortierella ambigua]